MLVEANQEAKGARTHIYRANHRGLADTCRLSVTRPTEIGDYSTAPQAEHARGAVDSYRLPRGRITSSDPLWAGHIWQPTTLLCSGDRREKGGQNNVRAWPEWRRQETIGAAPSDGPLPLCARQQPPIRAGRTAYAVSGPALGAWGLECDGGNACSDPSKHLCGSATV